ncbi:FMN-binding negative transcriptional regulator [Streptomyces sp. NPDC047315]|uniref:FMN-binding negative transcriptional regulator n=1 Tax=Streptomyces sp. NPDC047315 TaxID=3155142 RepID=UPI0033C140C8
MFVPSLYRQPDVSWMVDLMVHNPLALAASSGESGARPFVTTLPAIPDPGMTDAWSADLSGGVLLGHMNRANPHWKALRDGDEITLVFTGPHGYVSPGVYGVEPAAPTWNFTSVHVHGVVRKIEDLAGTLDVVKSTVRAFEAGFGTGWDMTGSLDYFRKIAPAAGAFRVAVVGAEGMFKLSQEQPAEVRERVRCSFAGREDSAGHRGSAELMARLACPHAD